MYTDKSREFRKWLYAILIALGPIAIAYGLIDGNQFALWAGLGATLLNVPTGTTALVNLAPKSGGGDTVSDAEPVGEEDGEVIDADAELDGTNDPDVWTGEPVRGEHAAN